MEEKDKKVDTTTENPAPGSEKKVEGTEKKDETSIDYKAELEKAKKELDQAQHVIVKLKKGKEKDESGDEKEEVDIEAIKQAAIEEAKREVEKFKIESSKDVFEEVLNSLSNDPDERELIKLRYETSINKTGFTRSAILSDLQNAKLLANKPRFDKILSETQRKVIVDQTKGGGSASGHDVGSDSITLSKEEESAAQFIAQRYGKSIEEVKKSIVANRGR